MGHRWAVVVGLGILLTGAGAWAQQAPSAPQIVTPGEPAARGPEILRGVPATPPEPAVADQAPRWQAVGGKRLWLVDQAKGEVRSCINQDTSTVGVRVIRCTTGELGRYGRTFGADFNP
jgi:hypothetical protein